MTLETLQKRIETCKANLIKLERKFNRIKIAEESNYEQNNPYYYTDYDKRVTVLEIEEIKNKIFKYEEELNQQIEKNNSRKVQIIIDFLNSWKDRVYKIYEKDILHAKKMFDKIKEISKKIGPFDKESVNYHELEELHATYYENLNGKYIYKDITNSWNGRIEKHKIKEEDGCWEYIKKYFTPQNTEEGLSKLKKDLDTEANAKYDFIIEKTNKIIGEITSADNLYISNNGELNGIITGIKGKVRITTIIANGPIRISHFRVLVKKIK